MEKIIQTGMRLIKSTAGTHVYEVNADRKATAHVTTVYVKKSAFLGEAPPQEMTLTMEPKK